MPSPKIRPYEALSPWRADVQVVNGVVTPPQHRRRAVAICGAAGAVNMPWEDEEVECWAINNFWNMARDSKGRIAASRWWEQHQIFPNEDGPDAGTVIQDENDMQWIRECPVPLYTTEPFPENPNAVRWPIEHFAAKYRDYFACSFAMQIVQAFDEGFAELHVYGLELLLGTQREATIESSCVNYWLGFVEGRGMKVVLAPRPQSIDIGTLTKRRPFTLAHPYQYGHQYWEERRFVERYLDRFSERPVAI